MRCAPHVDRLNVFEAAAFGDLDRLTELLAEDPELVGVMSGDGFTPLHLAAFFGQADAVRLLLARGAAVDRNGTGWMTGTPLHAAASGSGTRASCACCSTPEPIPTIGSGTATRRCTLRRPTATSRASNCCSMPARILQRRTMTAKHQLMLAEREDDLVIVERLRDAAG